VTLSMVRLFAVLRFLFEGGGRLRRTAALLLLIGIVELAAIVSLPVAGGGILDALVQGEVNGFRRSLSILLMLTAAQIVLSASYRLLLVNAEERLGHRIRERALRGLFNGPYATFERFGGGDLVHRVVNDAGVLKAAFGGVFLQLTHDLLATGAVTILLFRQNVVLALITVAALPISLLVVRHWSGGLETLNRRVKVEMANLMNRLQSWVSPALGVRVFSLEERAVTAVAGQSQVLMVASQEVGALRTKAGALSGVFLSLPSVIVFSYGGYQVMSGHLSVGDLFAFVGLSEMFGTPLRRIIGTLTATVPSMLPSLERVQALLCESTGDAPVQSLPDAVAELRVEDLSVRVGADSASRIVKVPKFRARKGDLTAICGPNGAGKSVFMRALAGLYAHSVQNVVALDEEGRQHAVTPRLCAIVPQTAYLFDGSVAQNIAMFGNPDASRLWSVIDAVGIREWISSLPAQVETRVDGALPRCFSGGETQRISLARALYQSSARVFLLDEPTMALDPKAWAILWPIIQSLRLRGPVVIVTHEPTLLSACDRVYEMAPAGDGSCTLTQVDRKGSNDGYDQAAL